MSWNKKHSDEFVAEVKKLAEDGASSGELAARFGLTRNVLIGIAHRNGFSFKSIQPRSTKRKAPPKPKVVRVKPRSLPKPPKPVTLSRPTYRRRSKDIKPVNPVRLVDAKPFTCRYVIGDPNGPDTMFCGDPMHGDTFWLCRAHKAACTYVGPRIR